MAATAWRCRYLGVGLVLTSGCPGTPPSNLGPAPTPPPAASTSATASPAPVTASASAAPSAPLSAAPALTDACAVSEPKLVLPKRAGFRGFDVGPDGRLYWVHTDSMGGQTQVFARDLADVDAKPERVVDVKLYGDADDLVVGRDGFWLSLDNDSRGMCGSTAVWIGRDPARAIPVSAPACVFGPKRAAGDAEALWATSATYSHPLQVFVARGAPPAGVTPVPPPVEGDFELVAAAEDGVYVARDGGEIVRRHPDGTEAQVAAQVYESPSSSPRAIAVHGDDVFLAASKTSRKIDLFRIPRRGGKREPIGAFLAETTGARLLASHSGVVLHLVGNTSGGGSDRLLLVDPSRRCPDVALPTPSLSRRVLVDRDVVYVQQDRGVVAISLASRRGAPGGAR